MDRSQLGVKTQFSRPVRQIVLMVLVICLVAAGSYVAYPRVSGIFLANIWLNGLIFCVFVIGVLATFWQVIQLNRSIVWIEGFAAERPGHEATIPPGLSDAACGLLRGGAGARRSALPLRSPSSTPSRRGWTSCATSRAT